MVIGDIRRRRKREDVDEPIYTLNIFLNNKKIITQCVGKSKKIDEFCSIYNNI